MALDDLIVNNSQHMEIVERIISPYVRFSPDGSISFLESWFEIGSQKKVLLFMVVEEARRLLAEKLPQRTEPILPRIIEDELRMPGNTIRPRLKSLREIGYLSVDRENGYSLNIQMLSKIESFLRLKEG